jgi:hypothetical protein
MGDVVRGGHRVSRKLLRTLEEIVKAKTGLPVTESARSELKRRVSHAAMVYAGTKVAVEAWARSPLQELAEPLARVIALLKEEEKRDEIIAALGYRTGRFSIDPSGTPIDPIPIVTRWSGDPTERKVAKRHRRLLAYLRAIARATAKRKKKGATDPFHDLVDRLATAWERASGEPFRQHWHKGAAINSATQFVRGVVEVVAPERLRSLPKMTERIVHERIAQLPKN